MEILCKGTVSVSFRANRKFFPFLHFVYSFMFLYFLRTSQFLCIKFFINVLAITLRVTYLKNLFIASPSLLGAILRYFRTHFSAIFLCFLRPVPSYFIKVWCFLYYPASQGAKKNYTEYIPLLRALCSSFELTLCILLNVLRNLKKNLDIPHKCLVITLIVTRLTNGLIFPLPWMFWGGFGLFCSMFLKQ